LRAPSHILGVSSAIGVPCRPRAGTGLRGITHKGLWMQANEVPDWRIYFAARVGDVVEGDGALMKPGDLVIHLATTRTPEEGAVAVPVVSPYRLSLNIAIHAARAATTVRKNVIFRPKAAGRKDRELDLKSMPSLFDFFEQCMIAATFSYQAIETYANARITEELAEGATISLQRNEGPKAFDATELQRAASTNEKVVQVLPEITGIALDKSSTLWQDFVILNRVRDSTIHLKAKDHFIHGGLVDRETLFYRLLNNRPTRYPKSALALMRHFSQGTPITWLDHAEALLAALP